MTISFQADFDQDDYFIALFDKFIQLTPSWVTVNLKRHPWSTKSRKILEQYRHHQHIFLMLNDNADKIETGYVASKAFRYFTIVQESAQAKFLSGIPLDCFNHRSFLSCYIFNYDYYLVQSQKSASQWNYQNIDPRIQETLKRTPTKPGLLEPEYLIEFNPGSSKPTTYGWLKPGCEMWFGTQFYNLISKEKIVSFPYASEIRQYPEDIAYVKLYDDIFQPFTPDNIFRQWKWKEFIDYDALIKKFDPFV